MENQNVKKILITGGSGFLGTHLAQKALTEGWEVTSYDLKPSPLEKVNSVNGNILEFTSSVLEDLKPDVVAHLAGLLGTSEQMKDPEPSVEINITGTLKVLKALREKPLPALIPSNGNYTWLSTYPITRNTATSFALMFNKEFGTKVATLRIMNAYGEYQKTGPIRKIIPTFIMNVLKNEPIEIFGDGNQIADLVYAGDVAEAMFRVLQDDFSTYDKIIEVGSGIPLTINEVAEMILEISGSDAGIKYIPMRIGEPDSSTTIVRNPEDLKKATGYIPNTPLREGLERTIKWYREKFGQK